ncbi:MAG: hypothetical protein KKC19_03760 [Nanoarchaeota archaeon]|nr:hypothetical protein [Nanoarchaeota archaeon]
MTRQKLDCDTYECPYNIGHDCRYDSGVVQIRDGKCRSYEETMREAQIEKEGGEMTMLLDSFDIIPLED